jgi:Flp pilus assembly protein TadG
MIRRLFQHWRNESGVSAIEFALLAPVLLLFLTGFFDFGYWMYVRSTAIGALEGVARSAGVGGSTVNPGAFQTAVEDQIKQIAPSATFTWNARSYYDFSRIGNPEKLITDQNGNGQYDTGDCWQDSVPNGVYDATPGAAGVGGADDIVFYQLTVSLPPIIDISGFMPNLVGNHVSVLNTIVRRQPFAAQATPPIRC